jgi:hypothetical protein
MSDEEVHIKNHALNTSQLHVGFLRYSKNAKGKAVGLEIIIFPIKET